MITEVFIMEEKNKNSLLTQKGSDAVQLSDELLDVTGGIGDIAMGHVLIIDHDVSDRRPSDEAGNDVQTATGGHKPPASGFDGDLSF